LTVRKYLKICPYHKDEGREGEMYVDDDVMIMMMMMMMMMTSK